MRPISFGDAVRVRSSLESEAAGVAGKIGEVYGVTTPSISGVDVIGEAAEDHALNVYFEDLGESLWFSESLLEFVDHMPGSELRIEGVPKSWVRLPDGTWEERADSTPPKRWWQFWK